MFRVASPLTFLKCSPDSAEHSESRITGAPLRKTLVLVKGSIEVVYLAVPLWEEDKIRNGYECERAE
jgi:hypothetical protein